MLPSGCRGISPYSGVLAQTHELLRACFERIGPGIDDQNDVVPGVDLVFVVAVDFPADALGAIALNGRAVFPYRANGEAAVLETVR